MSEYTGRVALVTGASAGIGAAIAEDLTKAGLIVIGGARRVDRIEALAEQLAGTGAAGRLIPRKLDVSNESEIVDTFQWAEAELGGIDVLVNNAAVLLGKPIHQQTMEDITSVMNVNVLATIIASRELINSQIRRKLADGYIVNINSIAGRAIPHIPGTSLGIYPMTKFAMTAECELLRHDIRNAGLKIRVSSINPGGVLSEMTQAYIEAGLMKEYLVAEDVAKSVNFLLCMPKGAEVTDLTIRTVGEIMPS